MLSLGFFGVFMAFNAAQSLATSISGKLGNVNLATIYVTFAIASVFAPQLVNRLGPKTALVLGSLPYTGMVLSFLSPSYHLMVPLSFLTGLGAPLLWTAEGVLVSRMSLQHAAEKGLSRDATTSYFNSIFFSSFQLNGVVGTALAGLILSLDSSDAAKDILFVILGVCAACGTAVFLVFVRNPPSQPSLQHHPENHRNRSPVTAEFESVRLLQDNIGEWKLKRWKGKDQTGEEREIHPPLCVCEVLGF